MQKTPRSGFACTVSRKGHQGVMTSRQLPPSSGQVPSSSPFPTQRLRSLLRGCPGGIR